MNTLKDMVNNNQKVQFQYYREGELWYATESGFQFPVPLDDVGNATFLREDKALLFMRYIRKHLEHIEKARKEQVNITTLEAGDENTPQVGTVIS